MQSSSDETTLSDLERIAKIRERDRHMYRSGGSNLQMREDVHFLLRHLDEVLSANVRQAS